MPINETDPWREQYFEGVPCPDNVVVPTDDGDAYNLYPAHRWLYNKLLIAESQGIQCAPHGLTPPELPVFSKPIYNMRGIRAGSRVIRSLEQWRRRQAPGHMWMEMPIDQRPDDGRSLVFDGEPLEAPLDILGAPELRLVFESNRPVAQVIVRLNDVFPDGTSARVS